MLFRMTLAACAVYLTLGLSASAHDYKLGELMIHHPWARASIGQAPNGAAYLTIMTESDETDRLLSAESAVAERVELHTHLMEDGVMKMRPVEAIEVAPGEPAMLQPGGLHVMLLGLKSPLVEGESFPMTLVFERAGKIEVEVKIEKSTATEAPGDMKEMEEHEHSS